MPSTCFSSRSARCGHAIAVACCAAVCCLVASACAVGKRPPGGKEAERGPGEQLRARKGDLIRTLPMTGEVDAVAAVELKVPRVPNGKVMLRKLLPEGAEVKAGEVVARLDSASFVQQIKDLTLQLSQAEIDLERQLSQNGVQEADRALDLERKKAMLKRAEVDADVPEGILPKRDFLEKQMAVRRAKVDVERAEAALVAQQTAAATDVKVKRIAIEKLRRTVEAAEEAIETLTLTTTESGTLLLGDHQEERRKIQEGDELFMGMVVGRVAGSRSRRVRAWLADVDDGKIAVGMPAVVVLDAYPGRSFPGRVNDISPVAQTQGQGRMQGQRRVFTVGIELGPIDAEILRPGLSARVEVQIERQAGVVLVPRAALDLTGESPRLLLASGETQQVSLAGCNAQECVVPGGVREGTPLRRALP
jgi:HlyD family secretion protein